LGRNPRAARVWGVGGRGSSYIGGGRWVGRRDRAPDAWRPSAASDMAAQPLLSTVVLAGESRGRRKGEKR
jgi:hypothetical protein